MITLEGDVVRQKNEPVSIEGEDALGVTEFGATSFDNFRASALHGHMHGGVSNNEDEEKRHEAEARRSNQAYDIMRDMIDGHYQNLSQLSDIRLSRILQEHLEHLREHRRHCHDREHAKELDQEINTVAQAQQAVASGDTEAAREILEANPQVAAEVLQDANAGTTPNFNAQAQGAAPAAHVGHDHDRAPVAAVPTAAP